MSITIVEARPDSVEAGQLIAELDAALNAVGYPTESRHGFSIEKLLRAGVVFFVSWYAGAPAGCGGLQLFGTDYGEIKRMYVRPAYRGLGLAKQMLNQLAACAQARRVRLLRLETGIYQKEAIRLYEQFGFQRRGPFGDYTDDPISLYFEKRLT